MSFDIISHNVNSNRRPYSYESNDKLDTCSKEWLYLYSKISSFSKPIIMLQQVSYKWSNLFIVNLQKESYIVHYNPANKTLIAYPNTYIVNQMTTISLSDFKDDDIFLKLEKKIHKSESDENDINIFSQFYNYFKQWVSETTPVDVYTTKSTDNAQKYIRVIKQLSDKVCPVFNCIELKQNEYGKSVLFANIVFNASNTKYIIWIVKILLFYLSKISENNGLVVAAHMPGVEMYSDIYNNITQPETVLLINDNDLYVPEIDKYISANIQCLNDAYMLHHSKPPPCTRNTILNDVPIRETCDYIFVNKNINITEMNMIKDSMETIPNSKIHSEHYPFEYHINRKLI